ncbi:hypothetical protein D915_000675 [Fasciola hepatica]|uniref:CD59-like protein n=1 Tax=Fasciola hepatica TaxID=6192 RepID=A0A4E0S004_FASHE|nr:hypothetical protein D915_000675 [Fasciola hepatica]
MCMISDLTKIIIISSMCIPSVHSVICYTCDDCTTFDPVKTEIAQECVSCEQFRRFQYGNLTYANRTCARVCSPMHEDHGELLEERRCCKQDLCNSYWPKFEVKSLS